MKRTPRVAPTRLTLTALAGVSVLALTACSGGGGASVSDDEFSVFINVENTEVPAVLETLAGDTCSAEAGAQPLSVETVPQTNLDQQLQLKAGQGDLPVLFSAGNAPALTQTLAESGNIADFEALLTESGQLDKIEPAAVSTIENLYGSFAVLPFEYNVEGIWYNKTIFDEQGIAEPQTWDELTAASEKLDAAGIQPFSASGEQGWPITRLISSYLFRTLGPDAMQKVADGEAKLTDPEYVEAAQAIADLGAAGYFGQGVGSIDMATSENQFLNGSAAMFYMGSWFLSGLNDPEANRIGVENVGFMPFPGVEGGAGDRSQLAANVGLPLTMNANATGENSKAWLSCIVENYGSTALAQENRVSGFALSEEVADVPPLTQLVQDQIAETETTVLWFEALFSPEATTTSQRNAAQLVTGSITAEDFMAQVQADLG
ncbi:MULTISPECIES: ABC transporter substrate-binding protein [unclassified Pseudoclavibacter]|uniref:ABC transporter substrate-binding protein n=1 Tax=unclassified Pseudoclavibacter TaxID=2615177 RepID=UPI000CE93908|nr:MULTISPECIES: extracellular solute-binding protein [unclassified Pseudoclavibacter]MBF4460135.1 extracellular solute-binding protein [Pseudoclavibacter sp. VKM Ac-2867]PPF72317.1 ABC transporter substrate-binding protein [Pseudoclavibacter sp. Z016]PPG00875.1 ABC transporter substrate-binding protein [Pseudoclavibacter sp. RFBI5]